MKTKYLITTMVIIVILLFILNLTGWKHGWSLW